MIATLRGARRAAGFILWTVGLGVGWLGLRVFVTEARRARGGAFTLHLWARGLCRLLGVRMTVTGKPCAGPSLRVSNHLGYLDIVVLAASAPALFVSKDDLAGWPVLGHLGKSVGTLFLDRTRPRAVAEVGDSMTAAFAAGVPVIVFPEGTTTEGRGLAPFHASLFEPAVRAGVPVQPVALDYGAGREHAVWTGDATFAPHFWNLLKAGTTSGAANRTGQEARGVVEVRVTYGEIVSGATDRRAAAEAARAWIASTLRGDGIREE